MAQRSIADLVINLRANTASFVKELDKSRTLSTAFGVTVGTVMANVATSVARMAVNVATSIPRAFLAAVDSAEGLNVLAQRTQITTETLSALRHQAQLSDVSFDSLTTAISRFTRNVGEAVDGNKKQAESMRDLGVDLDGVRKGTVSVEDALFAAIDTVAKTGNQFEKARIGVAGFGRGFAEVLPLMNQGRAGFSAAAKEAERLGLIISGATAKAADDFNDNMDRLKLTLSGLASTMAAELLPGLVTVTNALVTFVTEGGKIKSTVQTAAEGIKLLAAPLLYTAESAVLAAAGLAHLEERFANLRLEATKGFNFVLPKFMERDINLMATQTQAISARVDDLAALRKRLQDLQTDLATGFAKGGTSAPPGEDPVAKIRETEEKRREELLRMKKKLQKEMDADAAANARASLMPKAIEIPAFTGRLVENDTRRIRELKEQYKATLLEMKEEREKAMSGNEGLAAFLTLKPPKFNIPEAFGIDIFFADLRRRITEGKDTVEELRIEFFTDLPVDIRSTAAAVSDLNLAFSNTLPDAAKNVEKIDAAFERMGLTSGLALSGIAAQAAKDFNTISMSGQASAKQIAEAFVRAQEALKAAAESGFETWTKEQEKALRAGQKELEDLTDSVKETRDTFLDLAHTLTGGFEDAILGGKGLREVLSGILEDIGRIILRLTTNRILETVLSGLGGAIGGAVGGGSSFGSGGGYASGTGALTGARAMGGPVTAGGSFLVGERGPEIFSPGVSGTITPNAGTVNVTIQQSNTINTGARPEEVVRALELVRQSAVAEAVHVMVQRQLRT